MKKMLSIYMIGLFVIIPFSQSVAQVKNGEEETYTKKEVEEMLHRKEMEDKLEKIEGKIEKMEKDINNLRRNLNNNSDSWETTGQIDSNSTHIKWIWGYIILSNVLGLIIALNAAE